MRVTVAKTAIGVLKLIEDINLIWGKLAIKTHFGKRIVGVIVEIILSQIKKNLKGRLIATFF
jgi:hypothetical protein